MTTRKKPGRRQLPPPTNQQVSLRVAADYTKRYQRSAPASEKAGFFFADGLKALLSQPGVYGMRIYHGLDDTGRYRMVLVGVDEQGNDIVQVARTPRGKTRIRALAAGSTDAMLLDTHIPCPPWCPQDSPLA